MKLKLFLSLTLAVALCFYGCTKTVYVIETSGTTETPTDGTGQDVNSSDDSNSGVIYDDAYFSEPGDGTKENPYSVSQAIEIINSGECEYRMIRFVKGVVAFIKEGRGKISDEEWIIEYYISEDGSYEEGACLYMGDGTGLGGNFFSSRDALSEGDKVIVYGYLGGISGGLTVLNNKLYYLNGEYGDLGENMEEGDGTKESPYAVWQALDIIYNGTFDPNRDYFVKGIVFYRLGGCTTTNGSLISYTVTEASGHDGYVWGINIYYGWGLEGPFTSIEALQSGDQVVVCGKFLYDDDIAKMPDGELFYLNGEYGNLDIHEYYMKSGEGTRENPYAVPQAVEAIEKGSYDPDMGYYVKGIAPFNGYRQSWGREGEGYTISYNISSGSGYIDDETCLFYIYNGTALGGEKFASFYDLSGLDQVVVYGKLTSDDGKAEMIGGQLVYLNGETAEAEEE